MKTKNNKKVKRKRGKRNMPGYIIHLAVGKVYSKNNKIECLEEFERGIIAPDMAQDKAKSHNGPYSSNPGLYKYIQNNKILTNYQEGYFLHLVTDYIFYNQFLEKWDSCIYEDYDKLNNKIAHKYEIVVPNEIQEIVRFKKGESTLLKEKEIYHFIHSVGNIDIRQMIEKNEIKSEEQIELYIGKQYQDIKMHLEY